jgi:hypothetical protein
MRGPRRRFGNGGFRNLAADYRCHDEGLERGSQGAADCHPLEAMRVQALVQIESLAGSVGIRTLIEGS